MFTLSVLFTNTAKATHAAGGEISYEWVSDSTYRVYFKFYRDCSGAGAPGNNSVLLCITNSCTFYSNTVYMNRITKLPDSSANGSPVSTGCAGVGTRCSSSTSVMPGYQEWWYSATVTLPSRCNAWKFNVQLAARNPSVNLVNAGSTSLYVEATLNNVAAQGNSSPYFSVKPVPSVCINQNYTYNNGGVDPNSDSLVFEMSRPQNTAGGCPMTTTNITYAAASPAFNTTTNPLQTNNSFVLDTTTGQMTFKPTQLGAATLTTVIKEYRNGVLIGTVMRDIQVYVINCSVPGPIVNTVSSTISGATLVSGKIQACAGVAMSFCFDMKSTDTAAKLKATDNHNASAPNSSVTYTGQGTDSIRGCFSWTPGTLDTGLRVFTVTVKDSTCKSPGALISQTFVLPIYIWPITDIVKDTTLCYGDTVKLIAVGGSVFTWSALAGGSGITSLSCTTCKEPFAWPTTNTQYRVTNSATQYCSKNSDTVTVNILDIRYDTLQATSNSAVCEGDSLKLFSTNAPTGYGYRWTGPGGFSSTSQNPVVPNVALSGGGNYILKSSKLHCTSRPDTTAVTIKPRPAKPTATNNGAICAGSTLNLYATNVTNATYIWSGPASFSSTLQNPSISNADTSKSGKYIVRAISTTNSCLSLPDTTTAVINHIPVIGSVISSQPTSCSGTQGTITLGGLKPSTSYIVNYSKNSTPQSPANISTNGSGSLVISGLSAATYSQIRVTLSGCTSAMAADVILSDPSSPVVNASSNSPLCVGDTILLSAAADSSGVTYSWTGPLSFSSTTQNPSIPAATVPHTGSYVVTATKNNCTSQADTVIVDVFPIPVAPLASGNSPICSGDSLVLSASSTMGATYNWDGPNNYTSTQQNPVRVPSDTTMSGVYSVSVTVNGCTSAADTTSIMVKQTPTTPLASSNSPVCEGDTIKLFASTVSGATYLWNGPSSFTSTLQNPLIAGAQNTNQGFYSVRTIMNACSSSAATTRIFVDPTPAAPVASNNGPLCTGNILQLNASSISNATYSWTGPSGYSSTQQNPVITNVQSSMSGMYIVIAKIDSCSSLPDTTSVSINTTPAPVIGGSSITHPSTCGGSDGSITLTGLTVSTTFTVNFNFDGTPQSPSSLSSDTSGNLVIANLPAGIYDSLTVTATSGCVSVPVNGLVLIDPSPPSISLDTFFNPGTCGGSDGSIHIAGLTANTSYIVNFKRNNVSQTPRNLSSNGTGRIVILNLDAAVYSNITVTAANNCTSSPLSNVALTDPNPPTVTATNNTPICEGDTLKIFADADSAGVTWSWTGPMGYSSSTQNPVFANALPALTGMYTLTATKNNCTSAADSTYAIVHPTPATPVAGSNSPLCTGDSLMLTASNVAGATYSWAGPLSFSANTQNTGAGNVDTPNTGNYIVTATVNNCVSLPDTAIVIVYDVPIIDTYAYSHPTTCGGNEGTVSLYGLKNNTNYTVNFRHNSIAQAPQNISTNGTGILTISSLSAGTYTGIAITQNNCTSDSVATIILIDPNAPVINTSNNSPICEEDTLKLFATADSAGVTWSWTGPLSYSSTSQNPVIVNALPAQSGMYILAATKNNCTSIADTTTVIVHPTPATPVAGSNSPLCTGDSLMLTASNVAGATYSWTGPLSFSANTQNAGTGNVDTPNTGNYIVTATVNNCVSLPDTAIVIVYDVPIIDTYAYSHPTTCGGNEGTVSLYGLKNNTNYTVNFKHNSIAQAPQNISTNGTGILTISGLSAGTYTGIAITQNNCTSDSVSAIILIDPNAPVVNTSNNSPICEEDTLKLFATADSAGVTWSWSGPLSYSSTTQNPVITNAIPTQSGNYILTATKNNCTSIADTTTVVVHPTPTTPVAGSNSPLCTGDSLMLTASNVAGATYSWAGPLSFSANTQNTGAGNVDTPNTGNYIVTATVNNCVSLPDTAMVIVYDVPIIDTYAYSHPTTCGGNEGTVSLYGLKNNTNYTVNFKHNSIAQAPQNISTNGTGILTISGLSAGTYTGIAITQNNCTSDSVSAIILIDPNAPVVNTSNNSPICEEDTLKLFATADSAGVTWSWTGPLSYSSTSQNPVITNAIPAQSGNYILTATKNNCTSIADTTTVVVHPTPLLPTASNNGPLCSGNTLNLFADSLTGATYAWTGPLSFTSSVQNPSISNAQPAISGKYYVYATVNGCISPTDSTTVAVYPLPAPIIGATTLYHPTTCGGNDGKILISGLNANATYTVNYLKNGTAQSPASIATNGSGVLTIANLTAGNYTNTTVTSANGCTSDPLPAMVLADPVPPVVTVSAFTHPTTCLGGNGTITLSGLQQSSIYKLMYRKDSVTQTPVSLTGTSSGTIVLTGLTKGYYDSLYVEIYNCYSNVAGPAILNDPNPPVVTASAVSPICEGASILLTGTSDSAGVVWSWSGPMSFTSSVQNPVLANAIPVQSGIYTLYATKNNCTSATDTATVLVHPTPATPVASDNTPICSGSILQLTSSTVAGATYEWTGPKSFTASIQSPAITNADSSHSGNYIVRAIVNNCYSLPDTTTAIVHQVPEIDSAEYMHPITCNGTEGSIILTGLLGNTAYTVQYNKNSTPQPSQLIATNTSGRLAITGLGAGLYSGITVTLNNCTSDSATAIQLVDPNLPVVATNNNTPICEGDTLRLFASADSSGVTWSWTGPLSFSSTVQNPVITNALPGQSGMYILTATKNNCTSVADTTTVIIHPTPATPLASSNSPLCAGSMLQLISSAIPGATYYWTGPQSFSSSAQWPAITNADTFHSGDYIVYVTVNNCPSPKDTTTVVVHHVPAIDTFEYSNPTTCGGTQGTITVKGLRINKLYTVDFNRNGIAQAPQNINTNSTGNLVITGLNSGVYSGIRVTLNNCTSDSISPIILNDPNAPGAYASNNTAICQGDTLVLMATADSTGVSWQWSGPMSYSSTAQNPSVLNALPGMSGTYTITVTKNNCISIDTTTVIVHPTPATPSAVSNSPLCSGDTLLLIAPTVAGGTWSWAGPKSFTSSSQNPSVNSIDTTHKGNYIVTVSVNGCLSLPDTEVVNIYHLPAITGTSYGHPVTCGGTQGYISLSGLVPNATFTVTYKKNGTPQSPVSFSSNGSGVLTITGLNAGVYDSIRVAVQHCASNIAGPFTLQDPNAPAAFPSNNTDICQGDTLILYARSDSSGVTWSWTGPLSFTSTLQTHVLLNAQPAQSGTYFLTATKNNCSSVPAPTNVIVHATPPLPVVNSNSPLCPGDVLNLFAPNIAGASYQWTGPLSFSDTGRSASLPNAQPVNSGTYSVIMTINGCVSPVGSANVVINTTPLAPVVQPWVYYCVDDTAQSLTAIGGNLLWYTTATGGTGTPFAPVPATNTPGVSTWYVSQVVNGCEGPRSRIDVLVRPLPAPPVVTPALVYCQDAPTTPLTATGTSLLWYTVAAGGTGNANAPIPSSSTAGIFKWYVTQTDANGCESKRDSIEVTINPVFRADIQVDKDTVCVNDDIIVYNNNTTIPASTLTWSFDGANIISGDSSGPYILSYNTPGVKNIKLAVNNTDCDEDDSQSVYVAPLPDGTFSVTKDGCVNGGIELNPLWKQGAAYQWSLDGGRITDSTNKTYQATWTEPGNKVIVLIVYSGLGCSSGPYTAYTTIHDKPLVSIDYVSSYDVCAEDTIALRATDSTGLQYQWLAGSRLLQSEGPQALAIVTGADKIILTGTDEWGCRNTDSADVTAHTCCEIAVPNAFSPNNDGLNDRFRIITNGNQRIGTFIIVNRWGQKLFETNDVKAGWDGTHNGKPQVMDTYYYYIKYTCTSSEVFEKKGEVILLR
jgi:gliding motility-associated-like protein